MHLSNILLVLSLSTPFFSTLTASLAYLEVDTIVADTTIGTIDSIDPEIDVISPFQAYDDDVISYLIDDEGAASVVRRSRSRSQVARADHAEGQCAKRAVADWTYVGCTVDGEKRALPYLAREGGMTPQRCIAICEAQSSKYVYAGVQCESPFHVLLRQHQGASRSGWADSRPKEAVIGNWMTKLTGRRHTVLCA